MLSSPPYGQGTGAGARTSDKRIPADLMASSLSTVPPKHSEEEAEKNNNNNDTKGSGLMASEHAVKSEKDLSIIIAGSTASSPPTT
ncbi:hypothetical protein PoB_002553900 [Plakobranchus ocellatus]|uniref:Uncharacterized protein n=1 Tax=Plakobranchus ocellatus TaxID=259542 RepID=A0AAV3ZXC2_9GAST|nr:hypothetical protein PoB_002553900 [Plakobranchus ocellatus]